jgi:hypothetical protein
MAVNKIVANSEPNEGHAGASRASSERASEVYNTQA